MRSDDIKKLRLEMGISQEAFARILSVSFQTVRRWEGGLARPLPILSLKIEELRREVLRKKGGGMAKREEGKAGRGVIDIDVGVGLGGLFKGLGSLLDLASKMAEEGKEDYSRSGEFEALGGKARGVYGFSVRMGLGGKPVIEQFGNIRDTETGPEVAEAREPLVDVLDEGDRLVVIAELPGVEERDIHLEVKEDILEIEAEGKERKYSKEVLLPSPAAAEGVETTYKNGILEIRLRKKG
ncbi:MAG: helix-turn-helix domain-containing protein [Chloroflexi bacterium]|nr:helix-turn-helix domain-containing protein [Chloroflexota bacterium]